MKQILLIALISLAIISCKKEAQVENTEVIKLPHGLSKSQLSDIERIQKVFSEVDHSSLEKTTDKFRREEDPASEIKIWMQMADAYERFTKDNVLDQDKKQQAYELILLRSMMTEKEVREKIKSSVLSEKELKQLFSYYSYQPEPLESESK